MFGFTEKPFLSQVYVFKRRVHSHKINNFPKLISSVIKCPRRTGIVAAHTFFLSLLLCGNFLPVGASLERKVLEGQVKVVDGDTIRFLNGPRVRLSDIDAPELKQTCRCQEDGRTYPCGKRSKETLENIVRNRRVYCESDKLDIYGRWLGTCWTLEMGQKSVNINKRMIQLGGAVTYKGAMMYRMDEEAAKISRKGIWSSSFQWPWEFRKVKRAEL